MVAPSRSERIQLETAKQVKVDKADYNEQTGTLFTFLHVMFNIIIISYNTFLLCRKHKL